MVLDEAQRQIVDAQAYWPASATFPQCYGLEDIIQNICWFARMFAIGGWEVRWLDHLLHSQPSGAIVMPARRLTRARMASLVQPVRDWLAVIVKRARVSKGETRKKLNEGSSKRSQAQYKGQAFRNLLKISPCVP